MTKTPVSASMSVFFLANQHKILIYPDFSKFAILYVSDTPICLFTSSGAAPPSLQLRVVFRGAYPNLFELRVRLSSGTFQNTD